MPPTNNLTTPKQTSASTSQTPTKKARLKLPKHNTNKPTKKLERGGRNLVLLGVISTVIALVTVTVSLLIYHNSGDIYLDRSRPGFLPDEDEVNNDDNPDDDEDYVFQKSGPMTLEVLEEYLTHLTTEAQSIDTYTDPFGPNPLSNENLGI